MTSLTYNEDLMRQAKRTIRKADRSGKLSDSQRSALLAAGFPFEREISFTDHTGQTFSSVTSMCKAWGVSVTTYSRRIKNGWSVEEALVKPSNRSSIIDHTGHMFASTEEMCRYWKVSRGTYEGRLERGWSVEEALTGNRERKRKPRSCVDHTGREFSSVKAMCEAWGVDRTTFNTRTRIGWSIAEALTGNREIVSSQAKACTDHLGREYPSKKTMCEAWNVSYSVFQARIHRGWTIEEALTGVRIDTPVVFDHTGQGFATVSAMCEAWGVDRTTFNTRTRIGWSIAEALTGNREIVSSQAKACTDHLGREFASIKAMCEAWGVNAGSYSSRIKRGWTVAEALTGKRAPGGTWACTDHTGQIFRSKTAMCDAWGIKLNTFCSRIKQGYTLEEALTGSRKKGGNAK